jgi:hypothetical protein
MSARAHRNFETTIRHMRRKRRSIVERRRRNRRLLAGTAALLFAACTATTVASFTGTDLAGAAAVRAQSLVDLISQRSPGARTEAQLTKTKHRALAERDTAPAIAHVPANLAEVIAPPLPDMVPVDLAPPLQLSFFEMPPLPGLLMPPPPGGGGVPPGGGGGGCCGGPPSSPPETPPNTPPPPPVPEPGTWMTMLLGFGLVGWAMRRKGAAASRLIAPAA